MSETQKDTDTVYHVEGPDGEVLGRHRSELEARDQWHEEGGHADGADGVTVEEYDRNEHRLYSIREENVMTVDGMEIDIELRQQIAGADERDIDKVWGELKDHLGLIAQAFRDETPPSEIEERDPDNVPFATVDWDRVFNEGEE